MTDTNASSYSSPPPKGSRKRIALFISLFVLLALIGGSIWSRKREKPVIVTTERAIRKSITELVTATGKIQPEMEVKISPEVAGEIIEIPVREGQVVRKGALVLRIKPDTYRAQVEAQEAALNGARAATEQHRAELTKTEKDYQRSRSLFEQGLISAAESGAQQASYEIAKAALSSSLFEIERAQGALTQIREALLKTVILSPADGTISSLTSRVGERVVGTSQFAGTEVMRIADLTSMEARVNVNENDVINVKVGDAARIHVDAYPQGTIPGTVREIAATASTTNAGTQEQVTSFEVKIRIPDHSFRLRPGMSATVDIETATVAGAVAVPIQSVTVRESGSTLSPEELDKLKTKRQERDKTDNRAELTSELEQKQKERVQREKLDRVVFVKTGMTVRMRKVETGIADPAYIEIKKGIEPGDEVISGSYTAISRQLKEGAKVEIEKPGKG